MRADVLIPPDYSPRSVRASAAKPAKLTVPMGLAKAAQLNGYPGPAHVLALAGPLGLTDTQRRDVQAIFDRMSAAAKSLGGELIAQEQTLDQLFVKGVITPDRLAAATVAIAELQGRLRATFSPTPSPWLRQGPCEKSGLPIVSGKK